MPNKNILEITFYNSLMIDQLLQTTNSFHVITSKIIVIGA